MKKTTLNDIAGYETEKEEARKIIGFLKNYEEYTKEGITLTKGLVLLGKPGVGKTLLARAIANESGAAFIEFKNTKNNVEENVRETFATAKKQKPSILFIDEIDTLLPTYTYNEAERAVERALLSEMDGIDDSSGVLVIVTANTKYHIKDSLLRSGRLEKQITIDLPTYKDRIAIFDYYLGKHKELKNISSQVLAKKTNPFSGADVANLVNEVLLDCKAAGRKPSLKDFENYIPAVRSNGIRKENDDTRLYSVACHEAGHFTVNYLLRNEIASVTVYSYGESAGKTTMEDTNSAPMTFNTLNNELAVALAGLAGEKVLAGDVIIGGADSDISKAYDLAWAALNSGMLGFEYCCCVNKSKRPYGIMNESNARLEKTEAKTAEMLNKALDEATKLLKENLELATLIRDKLLQEHMLSSEALAKIVDEFESSKKSTK